MESDAGDPAEELRHKQSTTRGPKWRDSSEAQPESVTYALIDRGTRALTDRLIANAGKGPSVGSDSSNIWDRFPPDIRDAAWSKLSAAAEEISDDQARIKISAALRKFISHHRSFPNSDWALPVEEIDRVERIYNQFPRPTQSCSVVGCSITAFLSSADAMPRIGTNAIKSFAHSRNKLLKPSSAITA